MLTCADMCLICLPIRDDVGDHKQWAEQFHATRILHALEVNAGTADVEVKLQGEGPWRLASLATGQGGPGQGAGQGQGADDIELVFTPGHTSGHVCLLHEPTKTLFAGVLLGAAVCAWQALVLRRVLLGLRCRLAMQACLARDIRGKGLWGLHVIVQQLVVLACI
jgi:hypothetical protein